MLRCDSSLRALLGTTIFFHQFIVMLIDVTNHHVELSVAERWQLLVNFIPTLPTMKPIEDVRHGETRCRKLGASAVIDNRNGFGFHLLFLLPPFYRYRQRGEAQLLVDTTTFAGRKTRSWFKNPCSITCTIVFGSTSATGFCMTA